MNCVACQTEMVHSSGQPVTGLGWAWLAPVIQAVVGSQQQAGAQSTDTFLQAQAAIAQHRAAEDASARLKTLGLVVGGALFLGLGGWAVYRWTK